MNYILGTGRFNVSREWERIWRQHNLSNLTGRPNAVVKLEVGANPNGPIDVNRICVPGNLGHVGDLLNKSKPHDFCGWSAGVIALAMIAYSGEADLLYLEQDALAFGPWVSQVYKDLGDGDMVFGRKMTSPPFMACGQSLFLIRHRFIPEFVSRYLAMGPDGDPANLPETKFQKLEDALGTARIRRLSFGYDRERPINFSDPVFYAQKLTPDELRELSGKNLLSA